MLQPGRREDRLNGAAGSLGVDDRVFRRADGVLRDLLSFRRRELADPVRRADESTSPDRERVTPKERPGCPISIGRFGPVSLEAEFEDAEDVAEEGAGGEEGERKEERADEETGDGLNPFTGGRLGIGGSGHPGGIVAQAGRKFKDSWGNSLLGQESGVE